MGSAKIHQVDDSLAKPRFSTGLRWVVAVTALGAVMSLLDSTIVNVALHQLTVTFATSLVDIQWVVTGYLLALTAVIPATGWAAGRLGAQRLFLASVAVFTLASLWCGLASSVAALTGFRLVQGAAGGALATAGQILLVKRAGERNLARALAAVGAPMLIAPIVGPTIGGLLLDYAGWRWIFFVNLPIGVATLLLGLRFLPRDEPERARRPDLLGFVMIGLGMVAITYGLAEIGATGGAGSARVLGSVAGGLALLGLFVLRALRVSSPLLDVRLYKSTAFSAASLTTFCAGAAVYGGMIVLPLYLQTVRGDTAVTTGLLLIPSGLGAAAGMYASGSLTDRLGAGRCAFLGGTLMTVSTIPLAFLSGTTSYLIIGVATALRGIGLGLLTMPAMTGAFQAAGPAHVNSSAPQLNMLQRLGGSVGTAVFAVVLQSHLSHGPGNLPGQSAAFDATFWWVAGTTAAATIPALLMVNGSWRRAAVLAGRDTGPHGDSRELKGET